jgi:NAD(P)-dependent dehydrogenase (short-subunit alcohol dehydrogenase family)
MVALLSPHHCSVPYIQCADNRERAAAMSLQSLKRFVDPEDIAALIVFLTSDAGKSISGQVPPIDNDAQTAA